MRKLLLSLALLASYTSPASNPIHPSHPSYPMIPSPPSYDSPDTIVVSRDGTGQFRTIGEAIEVCRAFMDYHKVIFVKSGIYKEKLIIPSWLQHIEICGEDAEHTVITYDDHANIPLSTSRPMGTFRTYTLKIEGNDITLKNITVENNAARLGQAVALHTEGDRLVFIGCRFLGHQDTVYTGVAGTRLFFKDCFICGTTDLISSLAHPQPGLKAAPSRVISTPMSQQPQHHRVSLMVISSITVASRLPPRLQRFIWDVHGATMAIRSS